MTKKNCLTFQNLRGFTLIELIVVVSILTLLISIVLVGLGETRDKAKMAKTQTEMDQIKIAMLIYKNQYGELPPTGDCCSSCTNPPSCSEWSRAIDALMNSGIIKTRMDYDNWGNCYAYDDNDCNSNPGRSYLRTSGPDKNLWTSDDYEITITDSCAEF